MNQDKWYVPPYYFHKANKHLREGVLQEDQKNIQHRGAYSLKKYQSEGTVQHSEEGEGIW